MTNIEETPESIKQQRDALLRINGEAQKRADSLERTLELLQLAGHLTKARVEQAKALAQ